MNTLFSREWGTAAAAGKPPLVILHGLLGSSRNWQTVGAELSAHGPVFALDLRNHGRSPHLDEMTYAAMADDVLAWLDQRGFGQVTLLGHSMGGKVAMLLAIRNPERVARLVVVDIAPKNYHSAAHRAEFAALHELHLPSLTSRAEAELRLEARVADWAMRKFLVTNLEREEAAGGWRWVVNLPVLTAALPQIEANVLGEYDVFTAPTLVVTGGRSGYVRAEDEPVLRWHFPQLTRVTIPGAGHNPHMETRAEFVAALLAWGGR